MLNIQIQMHRCRLFSQNGEDGAVTFLLANLAKHIKLSKFFVEFGAWDGIHLSNTYALAKTHRFSGLYIEGDAQRFEQLKKNFEGTQNIACVNKYVEVDGDKSLQSILNQHEVPRDFDVLSIDIDGNDYQVWNSVTDHTPKIVVIEMNFRIKPGIFKVNDPQSSFEWGVSGSSISSLTELFGKKGYALISCIGCNAIFMQANLLHFLGLNPLNEFQCFTYEGHSLAELTLFEKIRKIGYRIVRGRICVDRIASNDQLVTD